jgi:hypothetical protein
MLFLGGKTRKKNKGGSKGNEINRFALGFAPSLRPWPSMARLKPHPFKTTTFRQSLNACALSDGEFLWRGEKAI